MGEHFPVRERPGNFEQTGKGNFIQNTEKIQDFYTKYWKSPFLFFQ